MSVYGDRIKEARLMNGWSQKKLADMCGTNQQTIARYESGQTDPQSSYIIAISKALNVSISYLLGIDSDNPTEIQLSSDELHLIQLYRSTDVRGRNTIMTVAESQKGGIGFQDEMTEAI